MKFVKGFLLVFILNSSNCTENLVTKLHGTWQDREEMDCPDFILFHKSGRYVILNDCGSDHPWMPVIERGDWEIRNKKEITLMHREFVPGGNPSFRNFYGEDSVLKMDVEHLFKYYKKVKSSADKMQRFIGLSDATKTLQLTPPGGATILKLKYKLLYPGMPIEDCTSEVLIEDQDGNQLWKKVLVFKHEKGIEEILLADKPEVINLTSLVFKIKSKVGWELQAKIYK